MFNTVIQSKQTLHTGDAVLNALRQVWLNICVRSLLKEAVILRNEVGDHVSDGDVISNVSRLESVFLSEDGSSLFLLIYCQTDTFTRLSLIPSTRSACALASGCRWLGWLDWERRVSEWLVWLLLCFVFLRLSAAPLGPVGSALEGCVPLWLNSLDAFSWK